MISLLIALIIIGALLYLLGLVPIDPTIRTIIYVIVLCAVAIYALRHLSALGF